MFFKLCILQIVCMSRSSDLFFLLVSWARFGVHLAPLWSTWTYLERPWGFLWVSLDFLWRLFGPLGVPLGFLWALLGFFSFLLEHIGCLEAPFGITYLFFWSTCGHLGHLLGCSRAHLVLLGHSFGI